MSGCETDELMFRNLFSRGLRFPDQGEGTSEYVPPRNLKKTSDAISSILRDKFMHKLWSNFMTFIEEDNLIFSIKSYHVHRKLVFIL